MSATDSNLSSLRAWPALDWWKELSYVSDSVDAIIRTPGGFSSVVFIFGPTLEPSLANDALRLHQIYTGEETVYVNWACHSTGWYVDPTLVNTIWAAPVSKFGAYRNLILTDNFVIEEG